MKTRQRLLEFPNFPILRHPQPDPLLLRARHKHLAQPALLAEYQIQATKGLSPRPSFEPRLNPVVNTHKFAGIYGVPFAAPPT